MRFSGRIRFGDVHDADLDVIVEVSETHVRLVSGDESLGSWCLADVVANRLVADEFEIDLDGEVIVFVADDQINFAYGAVQRMAEGWARYHAMNLVRRKRAVSGARRRNEPHRLDTVRRALAGASHELQRPPTMDETSPAATDEERAEEAEPDEVAAEQPEEEPVGSTAVAFEAEEVTIADEERSDAGPAPRFWERVERATAAEDREAPRERAEPEEATPEPVPMTNFAGRLPRLDALPRGRREADSPAAEATAQEVEEQSGVATEPALPAADHGRHEPAPVSEPLVEPASEPETRDVGTVSPAPDPAADEPEEQVPEEEVPEEQVPEELEPEEEEPEEEEPEELEPEEEEPDGEANGHNQPSGRAAFGSYRDGHHPSETSGLRASLRSLLSRSNDPHEHSFVESTTAVGINRRVCLECGHVSIGVSE